MNLSIQRLVLLSFRDYLIRAICYSVSLKSYYLNKDGFLIYYLNENGKRSSVEVTAKLSSIKD